MTTMGTAMMALLAKNMTEEALIMDAMGMKATVIVVMATTGTETEDLVIEVLVPEALDYLVAKEASTVFKEVSVREDLALDLVVNRETIDANLSTHREIIVYKLFKKIIRFLFVYFIGTYFKHTKNNLFNPY